MLSLLHKLLPFLKLFDKNIPFEKKLLAIVDTAILFYLCICIAIYFLSPSLYKEKLYFKNVSIYANDRNFLENKFFYLSLKKAMKKIESEPIYNKKIQVDLFFVDSRFIFELLTFFHDYIGINFFDKIFIDKNYVYEDNENNSSLIYSEIVHELTHSLQAKRYGGWIKTIIAMPNWVKEGYSVYCSRILKFDNNTIKFISGIQDIYLDDMSENKKYIVYGLMVKHAIEKMHKSVDDLHLGKVEYDEVLDSLLREYGVAKGR